MEPPEAAPDLVGRTSARLLAAGVDRRERLDALHLLAILDASTDRSGAVRRPLDDLAAEFELDQCGVVVSLDHLARAGAVELDHGTVVLLGRSHDGLGGLQLADFLEDVRASFDGVTTVDRPAPSARWLARAGGALVAAAAVFAVMTFGPANQTAVDQPLSAAVPTSIRDAVTSTSATAVAPTTTARPAPSTTGAVQTTSEPVVTPPAPSTVVAAECPTGSPVASIVGGVLWIANPTSQDLVVNQVIIGDATISQTISVPAGQAVEVASTVLGTAPSIGSWDWLDPTVAQTCER
jgi:hypothetical protein